MDVWHVCLQRGVGTWNIADYIDPLQSASSMPLPVLPTLGIYELAPANDGIVWLKRYN
jgi:hypothetical protein